jgi:hypothetical protein
LREWADAGALAATVTSVAEVRSLLQERKYLDEDFKN